MPLGLARGTQVEVDGDKAMKTKDSPLPSIVRETGMDENYTIR